MPETHYDNLHETYVPEKKKDEKWHKAQIRNFMRVHTEQNGFDMFGDGLDSFNDYLNHYRYYYGKQENVDYAFMEEIIPGVNKPATWLAGQKIASLIDFMRGTVLKYMDGFNVVAKPVTKEVVKARDELFKKVMLEFENRPVFDKVAQMTGVPFQPIQGFRPNTTTEISRFKNTTYKDYSGVVCAALATETMYANDYEELFLRVAFDAFCAGRGGVKAYAHCGKVKWRLVSPLEAIMDTTPDSDTNKGARFAGEQRFIPLTRLFQDYDFKEQDRAKILALVKDKKKRDELNSKSGISWWKEKGGEIYVRVVDIEWLDLKLLKYESSEGAYGETIVKSKKNKLSPSEKEKKKKELIKKDIITVRQGTLIGDCVLVNWGERNNQVRRHDNYSETQLSYLFFTPSMLRGQNKSVVARLKPHQDKIDLYEYFKQEVARNAKGKKFTYDLSQLPAGMSKEELLVDLQTHGIIEYDSTTNEGLPQQSRKFIDTIDMSVDDKMIAVMQQLIEREKMEMEEIVSIPKIAQGFQNQVIGKGVQENTIVQSTTATLPIYRSLFNWVNTLLQYSANLYKITLTMDGETEAYLKVSEGFVEYFKISEDFLFEDFDVYIDARDSIDEAAKKRIIEIAFAIAQNNGIDMHDYLELEGMKSKSEAIAYLKYSLEKKQAQAQAEVAAQRAHEAEMAKAQMAAQQQNVVMSEYAKNQREKAKSKTAVITEGMRQAGALEQQFEAEAAPN